jgi:hypothetical protein
MRTLARCAAVLAVVVGALAPAADILRTNMPSFYQHQKGLQAKFPDAGSADPNYHPGMWPPPDPPGAAPAGPGYESGNWWEKKGGWCATTAWVNALHYWDGRGHQGLFNHSNLGAGHQNRSTGQPLTDWDRFAYSNEDLAFKVGVNANGEAGCAFPADIESYLADHAGPVDPTKPQQYGYMNDLEVRIYAWDGPNNRVLKAKADGTGVVVTSYTSMFKAYENLTRTTGSTILMYLESPPGDVDWLGWGVDINFHVATGAGVDPDMTAHRKAIVSDPDKGKGGSHWGFAYDPNDASPIGGAYYTNIFFEPDGLRVKAGTQWGGSTLQQLWVISPEPTSLVLFSLTLLVLRPRRGA